MNAYQWSFKQLLDVWRGGPRVAIRKLRLLVSHLTSIVFGPPVLLSFKIIRYVYPLSWLRYKLVLLPPTASPPSEARRSAPPAPFQRVTFCTCVWGPYVSLYDSILLRSLFQSGNIPALLKDGHIVDWHIHTIEAARARVVTIIDEYRRAQLGAVADQLTTKVSVYATTAQLTKRALLTTMQSCVETDTPFIGAPPDTFFGNGSIHNIVKLSMNRDLCIAAAHLRVDAPRFSDLIAHYPGDISNAALVNLALAAAHQNLYDSFVDKDSNCSYISGVAIQKIAENLYAITHRLPTVYLARFTEGDLRFFTRQRTSFEDWDHVWPSRLIAQRRFKLIGSSDLFFAVEATEPALRICSKLNGSRGNDDYHEARYFHKELNRNFSVVLRADDRGPGADPRTGTEAGGH